MQGVFAHGAVAVIHSLKVTLLQQYLPAIHVFIFQPSVLLEIIGNRQVWQQLLIKNSYFFFERGTLDIQTFNFSSLSLQASILSTRVFISSTERLAATHYFKDTIFILTGKLVGIYCLSNDFRRQKGESQNSCFQKMKQAKFSENQTFLNSWYAYDVRVSGSKKCYFFGKFGQLCFLKTPVLIFDDWPYYRRVMRFVRVIIIISVEELF